MYVISLVSHHLVKRIPLQIFVSPVKLMTLERGQGGFPKVPLGMSQKDAVSEVTQKWLAQKETMKNAKVMFERLGYWGNREIIICGIHDLIIKVTGKTASLKILDSYESFTVPMETFEGKKTCIESAGSNIDFLLVFTMYLQEKQARE